MKPRLNQITEVLVSLVRDLHALLESHGPTWYTEEMDIRIDKALAVSSGFRNTAPTDTKENHVQR
jgi:hypothetical protein